MAVDIIANAQILLGPNKIGDQSNVAKIQHGAEMLDANVFGIGTKVHAPGLFDDSISTEGYTDPNLYGIEAIAFSVAPYIGPGAARIPYTVLQTDADGALGYSMNSQLEKFDVLGDVGQLNKYALSAKVGQGGTSQKSKLVRGTNLIYGSKTATGSGTPRQLGATLSTQRLFAALHVVSFTGTSLVMRLQRDDAVGFSTPATAITFATLTGVGFEWAEVAGPITDDWFRADWTFTGTSFMAYLLVGILTQR